MKKALDNEKVIIGTCVTKDRNKQVRGVFTNYDFS